MANFTKKALIESFLELIEKKPLNKITVKDITAHCQVNRNTFYYHFQDIPELIETLVCEDAESIIESAPEIESLEQCLDIAVSFALKRRRVMYHIYHSTERAIFEHHLWVTCEKILTRYYDMAISSYNINDSDRYVIIEYYKCLCFGVVISSLERGIEDDIRPMIHRICELKKGALEDMIKNCANS